MTGNGFQNVESRFGQKSVFLTNINGPATSLNKADSGHNQRTAVSHNLPDTAVCGIPPPLLHFSVITNPVRARPENDNLLLFV